MAVIDVSNLTVHYPSGAGSKAKAGAEAADPRVAGRILKSGMGTTAIQAIKDLSFRLEDGDWLGIVGSNGSGKTTLLNVLAGIVYPTQGKLTVRGQVTSMLSLGLGMLGNATGLQNIHLSGLVQGASNREIKNAIDDVAAFTELGDYLSMPMRTYSHGMAMRLKFACATAFQPDIILLDEWIGAGDAEFQEKARERMQQLLSGAGIVVIASHNRQLIRRVSTKMLWLERGENRAMGEPDYVLDLREQDNAARAAKPPAE